VIVTDFSSPTSELLLSNIIKITNIINKHQQTSANFNKHL